MTFKAFETSARSGKPAQFFLFGRQGLSWRFTNAARDITVGGKTYIACAISRTEIKETIEKAQDNVTITLPCSLDPNCAEPPPTQAFCNNWQPTVPTDPVSVICMAMHLDDPDQEMAVQWIGVVQQPKFDDNAGTLALTCVPPGQIAAAMYQGAKWQVACWKSVYSTGLRGCNLVAGGIDVPDVVTAISGSTVTAAKWEHPPRSFVGGNASWSVPTAYNSTVSALSGSVATLSDASGIVVGTVIDWTGGSGNVTGIAGNDVTLSSVAGLAVSSAVNWTGAPNTPHTANITAASGSTLTFDNVVDIAVGMTVTATTVALQTATTLMAVDGLVLTSPDFEGLPLSLAGGDLAWVRGNGLLERRSIVAHAGSTITLAWGDPDIVAGLAVVVRPGCNHTWADCKARGNTINYGGSSYKPINNPYNGQSMSWGNG